MNGSRRVFVRLVLFLVIPAVMWGCSGVCPPSGAPPSDDADQAGYMLPCLLCHEEPVGQRRAVVDESGAGGHTFGLEVLTADGCLVCHEMTQHARGSVRLWEDPGSRKTVIEVAGDPSKEPDEADKVTELCTVCHVVAGYAVHAVGGDWQPACTTCHDLHDPASQNLALISVSVYNRTLDIDTPVVFTARSGPGSFDDGDSTANDSICQVCHTNTSYHTHDGTGAPHYDGTNCTTCHPHDAGFLPIGGGSCIACHSSPQDNEDGIPVGGRPKVVNADGTGGHHLSGDGLADDHCVVCHEMSRHQQGTVRLWTDPTNPTIPLPLTGAPQELEPFCAVCHDRTLIATHPTRHTVGQPWEPSCIECHELHDPANANLSLVSDVVYSRTHAVDSPVIFTSREGANSFNDGDPAQNDGICQVCHTNTSYHRYDGSGTAHNDGAKCTTCHPHDAGFMPTGGASCIACHSSQQGTRPAVVNADGTGGHHLAGGVLMDEDCVVCHEMSRHMQGTVRVWTDPNNPTTPLPVTGGPKELVPFCSSCHDSLTHPVIHATGAAWEPVCTQCHGLHDPTNANLSLVRDVVHNDSLGVDKPVIFTARSGPGSFNDGQGANDGICQVCHTATKYHRENGAGSGHEKATNCERCHKHDRGFSLPSTKEACIYCHSSRQGSRPAVVRSNGAGGHHLSRGVLTADDCLTCHEMTGHRRGNVRLWSDPANPASAFVVTGDPDELVPFCGVCHSGADHPIIHTTGTAWEPVCTECHELHDPANTNLSLVSDVVRNETLGEDKPVIFTSRTGARSFDDGDPAQDAGICQVCHTATTYHLHDGTGTPHNNGMNCTVCHPHPSGFTPVDGASCIKCHTSGVPDSHHLLYDRPIPPGSVVLYPDSDRDGVPDSKYLCLSCHDEDFSELRDCTVCHSESNPHDTGPDATAGN